MDDSFRGTCLKCGGPLQQGNIHKDCAQLELQATRSFGDANKMVGQRQYTRIRYGETIARIPDQMANVQVCERCGSIGQAKDFLSLNASSMYGDSLVLPQLITRRQFERGVEESMEGEEVSPQDNFTLCRNCKLSLRSFLENKATEVGQAGPITPRLPNAPTTTVTSGEVAPSGT